MLTSFAMERSLLCRVLVALNKDGIHAIEVDIPEFLGHSELTHSGIAIDVNEWVHGGLCPVVG